MKTQINKNSATTRKYMTYNPSFPDATSYLTVYADSLCFMIEIWLMIDCYRLPPIAIANGNK